VILAVFALCVDEEFSVSFEKPAGDAISHEGAVIEIATHGRVGGYLHSQEVVRRLPFLVLLGMAGLTGAGSGEGGRG
jgi:hypothetical protein